MRPCRGRACGHAGLWRFRPRPPAGIPPSARASRLRAPQAGSLCPEVSRRGFRRSYRPRHCSYPSGMRAMTQPTLQFLGALLIACLPVGVIVYLQALRHLRRTGPRVKTAAIALPDLLVTIVLVTFLILQTAKVLFSGGDPEPPQITRAQILPNILIFLGFLVLLFAFLHARQIELRRFFGLHGLKPIRALLLGLGFIAAAFPILLVIGAVTQHGLGVDAREQELVRIFRESFIQRDFGLVALLASAAAITQPLCEEIFFRGYFYVVGKRYLGAIASACLTSTL